MNATTKITILIILILRLLGSGVGLGTTAFGPFLIVLSVLAFLFLIFHLLSELKTSFLIYSLILVFILIGQIGVLISLMHWGGISQMMFLGSIGGIAAGAMLVWSSLKSGKTLVIHLLTGLSTIVLFGAPLILHSYNAIRYIGLLNYLIAAFACTILLSEKEKGKGERNILIALTILSLFYIIKHTIAML